MRKDMAKIIVERERHGSTRRNLNSRSFTRKASSRDTLDDLPIRSAMKRTQGRPKGLEFKSFNENLNPLKSYLASKVGQAWDDVYSEIRKGIRVSKTIDYHIMQHLQMYVCPAQRLGVDREFLIRSTLFYVDEDGILQSGFKRTKPQHNPLFYTKKSRKSKVVRNSVKSKVDCFLGRDLFYLADSNELMVESDGVWYTYSLLPWKFTVDEVVSWVSVSEQEWTKVRSKLYTYPEDVILSKVFSGSFELARNGQGVSELDCRRYSNRLKSLYGDCVYITNTHRRSSKSDEINRMISVLSETEEREGKQGLRYAGNSYRKV